MEANGWQLFIHPLLRSQLETLTQRVAKLASGDPRSYQAHPAAKLLSTINYYIREGIPRDPNAPEFRQGNALGPGNRHWFRAKLHGRYRLFYRFSTQQRIVIYAWVNDEHSLRKSGSKTDPYARFKALLDRGQPPESFSALLSASQAIDPEH